MTFCREKKYIYFDHKVLCNAFSMTTAIEHFVSSDLYVSNAALKSWKSL